MADNANTAPPAASGTDPSTANLRIITLAHGSSRENDVYLSLPLDVTIGDLKERLKWLVAGSPTAEQQRLIYLGRPLLDNAATLRSVLRLQPAQQSTHVLHLVIRSDATTTPTSNQPIPPTGQTSTQPPQAQDPQARNGPQLPQMPPMPQIPNLFPNMLDPTQLPQQANIFQQHMAMHNQHLANHHPGMPLANFANIHQMHGAPMMPEQARGATQPGANNPTSNNPAEGRNNNWHTPQGMTMRVQETVGPNGERVRVVTNSSGPVMQREFSHMVHTNPVERSASAPGTADRAESPGITQMHRTVHHPHLPGTALPMPQRAFPIARPMLNNQFPGFVPVAPTNPTAWLLSSPAGPQALLFAPGHGFFSTTPSSTTANAGNNSTATNQQQETPAQPNPTQQPQQDQPQAQAQAQPNNVGDAQPRAEIVLRPQGQHQAPVAANMLRMQNRDGGEIAAFIVQRGWLFLRLYLFIFVLSEPGTWRRIILLGIATLICFLPQENPLTNAFNLARQHFDNLIGPPQPQLPREGGAQDGRALNDPTVNGANGAAAGQNAMPTPEEHARRLLRERQERNPNYIRGLLQPIEQALALFFASLIPGVGERHVRAREEVRRLAAEEEQRRRTEEQEHANQGTVGAGTGSAAGPSQDQDQQRKAEVSPTVAQGSSSNDQTIASASGIDAAGSNAEGSSSSTNEGLRQRTGGDNNNNQPPPNMVADW